MRHAVTATNAIGMDVSCVVNEPTWQRIQLARAHGATIIINTNPFYTGKQRGYNRVVKLSQTNSTKTGYPLRVIWACY